MFTSTPVKKREKKKREREGEPQLQPLKIYTLDSNFIKSLFHSSKLKYNMKSIYL